MKNIKDYFIPKPKAGYWSVGLIIAFFIFMTVFFYIVKQGERGGDTFFSNPKLAITILLAALSGIASFFTGLYSVFKKRDFSIFVFLSTLIGGFVLFWVIAEIFFPH